MLSRPRAGQRQLRAVLLAAVLIRLRAAIYVGDQITVDLCQSGGSRTVPAFCLVARSLFRVSRRASSSSGGR
jgi:hypothetical protein